MGGGGWEVLGGWLVVDDPAEGEGGVWNRGGGARSWRPAMVVWAGRWWSECKLKHKGREGGKRGGDVGWVRNVGPEQPRLASGTYGQHRKRHHK